MQVQVRFGEKSSQDFTVSYLIYLPESYPVNTARRWPLILFLHGSGEAGKNLGLLTRTGLPQKLESEPDFPFVVVSPQITAPPVQGEASASFDVQVYLETWGWKRHIDILEALLDYMQATYRIDPQRVFLTGISLGGFGAWEYALRHPDRFAAVVPIAGGFRYVDDELPTNLCDLKEVPIWTFHGELDTNVPLRCSQAAVYGLKACGTEVRFTQYPDLAHNVWTTAYNTPELWEWLLAQKKN
jgi:predicted peptidase